MLVLNRRTRGAPLRWRGWHYYSNRHFLDTCYCFKVNAKLLKISMLVRPLTCLDVPLVLARIKLANVLNRRTRGAPLSWRGCYYYSNMQFVGTEYCFKVKANLLKIVCWCPPTCLDVPPKRYSIGAQGLRHLDEGADITIVIGTFWIHNIAPKPICWTEACLCPPDMPEVPPRACAD